MLDQQTVDFIQTLRYPQFAAYVVGKLMKEFDISRKEATEIWEAYRADVLTR